MPTAVTTGQHARTARMDVHEVAAVLVQGLGPTLIAAMTGSKDRKLPSKWAKPDGPRPSADFTRRLQLGHRVWVALSESESEHVARQWFLGGNPVLHEDTPITAIREDRGSAVIEAVESFIRGDPDV
ncbi:hypothetical protein EDF35_1264 [Rathayibacter sp. PhB151]|uniref:hypothetical protein n=1 Tax=Rathayibacter sp. PhB151 TaxID=2485189 RepID=UPI001063EF59|nr:hypothetical protein [Rathayibacter sp. PhB151]TDX81594.1 hypothetical protein EDF35_1264 [Rathayibacter sp. PhB151]